MYTITAVGFKTSTGTSAQFLKADGSVDSNTYLTSSGTAALASGLAFGFSNITISNVTGANGTFSGNISAVNGTFSGDVSIAGTITYDDVTHVDSQGIGTFRQGINVVGHSELDTLNIQIATFQNNVHLADNVKKILELAVLQIYHDGSQLLFNIRDFILEILESKILVFHQNGSVDGNIIYDCCSALVQLLFMEWIKKLATTGVGATVTGEMHATTFHGDGSKSYWCCCCWIWRWRT